jgi:hypothetical protein
VIGLEHIVGPSSSTSIQFITITQWDFFASKKYTDAGGLFVLDSEEEVDLVREDRSFSDSANR